MKKLILTLWLINLSFFFGYAQILSKKIIGEDMYKMLLTLTKLKTNKLHLCGEADTENHYFCYQYNPTEKDSTVSYFSEGKQMSVNIQASAGIVFISFFDGDTKLTFLDTVKNDNRSRIELCAFLVKKPLLDGGKNWTEFKYIEHNYILQDFERNIDYWSNLIEKEYYFQSVV